MIATTSITTTTTIATTTTLNEGFLLTAGHLTRGTFGLSRCSKTIVSYGNGSGPLCVEATQVDVAPTNSEGQVADTTRCHLATYFRFES